MNNKMFFAAIAALAFTSCSQDDDLLIKMDNHTIKASMEVNNQETRNAFNSSTGALYWIKGDDIAVLNTQGNFIKYTLSKGENSANATFTAETKIGKNSTYALHPYSDEHKKENEKLIFHLPNTYTYSVSGNEYGAAPMIAVTTEEDASEFYFEHLGGTFCFTINNIPANTTYFKFEADEQITGDFTVSKNTEDKNIISLPETQSQAATSPNAVTIKFPAESSVSNKKFFIPLPVGTIDGFKISFGTSTGQTWEYTSTARNTIARKSILIMPDVTYNAQVNGSVATLVDDETALKNAINAGRSVKLGQNITLTQPLIIGGTPVTRSATSSIDITLDLNGKTLTSSNGDAIVVTGGNTQLTITGNGTVQVLENANGCAVWAHHGGKVIIENGTFSTNDDAAGNRCDCIYAGSSKDSSAGTIIINGGTFKYDGDNADGHKFLLNKKDNTASNITVKGGQFYKFDPANSNGEPNSSVSFVAEGYTSKAIAGEFYEVTKESETNLALIMK